MSTAAFETVTGLVLSGWRTWPPGSPNAYPIEAIATVDVYESVDPADGKVAFYLDGAQIGEEVAVDEEGTARMTMPTDKVGTYQVSARYTGTATQAPSVSRTLSYLVDPPVRVSSHSQAVGSTVKVGSVKVAKRRVRAKVVVSASRPASGRIEIRDGRRVVAQGTLPAGATSVILTTKKLTKGRHKLKIRFLGSPTVSASSTSCRVVVR
ncbi:Ig-like domain-containing protein [Nocardioides daeguensis]|uniref:Ig-like domain-containing protein n=1 Tax=Nocardioides daeguensis TaxID=908359 RepID=UPI001C46EECF|nr:Ig-like domain-containing protein [Nocardioides daeguensis]MBV6729395.1 Ig-like domain-containing protein [Nocardioides daeguensis]MCR1771832.1 Ig-like domain-containing protein [Nocardioides daeguensis]